MLIAQLSDLHIVRPGERLIDGTDSAAALRACVQLINALSPQPEVVVCSGDLADHGYYEEYINLSQILPDLNAPYYLMPGNHDNRQALREAFSAHAYLRAATPWMQYVVQLPGLRLLMLDTSVPGAEHGSLGEGRLAWLQNELETSGATPSMIFMHHPPFATGHATMDVTVCREGPQLEALLRQHAQAQGIACGHVHRCQFFTWAGKPCVTAPSSAVQLSVDLGAAASPIGTTTEPGGLLLHNWRPGTGLSTIQISAPTR